MASDVRAIEAREIPIAAVSLARAFDADPLFAHLLPEATSRARWLRWFFTYALREALTVDGAFVLDAGPGAGAIALYPANRWPVSLMKTLAAVPRPPGIPPRRLVFEGIPLEGRVRSLHPRAPHVYVQVLGVDPASKGKGLGGRLLAHALAMSREAGVVAHLETSNVVNLPFYRRFGFEVVTELTSHPGPPVWTMTTSA